MPTTLPESSQGSAVTFDGVAFAKLVGWRVESGSVNLFDSTGMSSTVIGTGANTRILRRKDPVSVDPAVVSASFLGVKTFTLANRGKVATLTLTFPNGSVSAPAILTNFTVEGQVNEYIRTSATFTFTQA